MANKGAMGNSHGHSSPDGKMGRHQNLERATDSERYQRAHGFWREPTSTQKAVVKHRAAKKRRSRDKKFPQEEL